MKRIYIISTQPYSGKTLVSVGIINGLIERGYKVGYIKPIGITPQIVGDNIYDVTALFIKELFSFKEPMDIISPFVITYENLQMLMREGVEENIKNKIIKAINSIVDKDFVIVGGSGNIFTGAIFGVDTFSLFKEIKTKLLVVENFVGDLSIDNILGLSKILKEDLAGFIINRIPKDILKHVEDDFKRFLEKRGIKIFGFFEKDEFLEALTVRDIVNLLNGKVLCCEHKLDEIVEHFTVGAMDVDNALRYFKSIPNKAVITGAHRSDIQLAALETSTKVIILTGGTAVNDVVLAKAISCDVPLVSVDYHTFSAVERIELALGKVRIKETKKIEKIKELFKTKFDWENFLKI